jgi:putative membrane protein
MGHRVGRMNEFHDGLGWGGWILWILLTAAFWALVIMAVLWLVRSLRGRDGMPQRAWTGPAPAAGPAHLGVRTSAEQILAERFAHGQIDEYEYRSRLAVLQGVPGPAPATPATPLPTQQPTDDSPPHSGSTGG